MGNYRVPKQIVANKSIRKRISEKKTLQRWHEAVPGHMA
jgi:hypothetical protein